MSKRFSIGEHVKCSCGGKTRIGRIIALEDGKATVKLYKKKGNGYALTKRSIGTAIEDLELTQKPKRYTTKKSICGDFEIKNFNFRVTEKKEITKANGKKYGQIAGYASTYGNVDLVNDAVLPGAFKKSLDRLAQVKEYIPMLWMHDSREVIGGFSIKNIKDDSNGLYVEGEINLDVQRGKEAYALALQDVIASMSIGYRTLDYAYDKAGVRLLKELDLGEISLVGNPANPKADILSVKSNIKEVIKIDDLMEVKGREEFNALLRKSGAFSRSACEYLAAKFGDLSKSDKKQEDTNKLSEKEFKNLVGSELKKLLEVIK